MTVVNVTPWPQIPTRHACHENARGKSLIVIRVMAKRRFASEIDFVMQVPVADGQTENGLGKMSALMC